MPTTDHHRRWRFARHVLKLALMPVALALAILYFLIDGVMLAIVRAPAAWLVRQPLVARLMARIARLGPYSTLALLLVPVILLEPLKPLALYIIAKRYVVTGTVMLVLAELLKIVTVERLFHLSRAKLMSIPAFARVFRFVSRWLRFLEALPPWQFVMRQVHRVKEFARVVHALVRRDRG